MPPQDSPQTQIEARPPASSPAPPDAPPAREHAPPTRPRRRIGAIWFLLFTAACITAAELLLWVGARETGSGQSPFGGFQALASWHTFAGIVLQIAGFAGWICALKSVPLALAFNFTMIQQGTVALGAWWLLGDVIPPARWAGIALLMLGVFLLVPAIVTAEEKTDAGGEK